jgi:copper(I)-binding protein
MGLKEPLKAGTAHPITFKFLRGGEVLTSFRVVSRKPVSVPADKAAERDAPMNHMEHMDHSAH